MNYEEALEYLRDTVKLAELQMKFGANTFTEENQKLMKAITLVCNRAETNTILRSIKTE